MHDTHAVAPALAPVAAPAAHSLHTERPAVAENVPDAQAEHVVASLDAPTATPNLPASHAKHATSDVLAVDGL